MNKTKVFNEFIDKHPEFAKKIVEYKEGKDNSLVFKLKDGKTAYYYPLLDNDESNYKKRKS